MWNRPNENKVETEKRGGQKVAHLKGIVAGLIVVILGAAVAWWMFSGGEARQETSSKKSGLIKEVKPALPAKSPQELEKEAHPGMVKVRGKWYPEYDKKGGKIWIASDWVRYHTPTVYTNNSNRVKNRIESIIFDNDADEEIAVLLMEKPGAFRIGRKKFDASFTESFLESLKKPIIVSSDDDEMAATLKRAVIDAKKDLKARYDAGEDIVQVMNETQKELRELSLYKEELRRMVRDTDVDDDPNTLRDLYGAANKMLEERGLSPLRVPSMLKGQLDVDRVKMKQEGEDGGNNE